MPPLRALRVERATLVPPMMSITPSPFTSPTSTEKPKFCDAAEPNSATPCHVMSRVVVRVVCRVRRVVVSARKWWNWAEDARDTDLSSRTSGEEQAGVGHVAVVVLATEED